MYNHMEDTFTNESDSVLSGGTHTSNRRNPNNKDPDFHHVKRMKSTRGYFTLDYYETRPINDARIRNAITGTWYRDDHPKCKYLVGSEQEDLFFKARVCTSENEMSARDNRKNAVLLFYDSPEQFEKHQRVVLTTDIKEKWHEKNRLRRIANQRMLDRLVETQ